MRRHLRIQPMPEISGDEWLDISRALEEHHALFYQLWGMGRPRFTESLPTAAVTFNREGSYLEFLFNPKFWESLDFYTRLFVIAHECLHVVLKHGLRTIDSKDKHRCGVALDIVDNHVLVGSFNFDRARIIGQEDICWVDTVFDEDLAKVMPVNECYEFYYRLIPPTPTKFIKILDVHDLLPQDIPEIMEKLDETLTPEEKQAIGGLLGRHIPDKDKNEWSFVNVPRVVKKKWDNVIKQWARRYLREEIQNMEQWARLARRLTLLPEEILLPTEMEYEGVEKDRLPVYLFLDTSGSCREYKDRFWKAGASLPPDKFSVRMFCFDDAVAETTIESKKMRLGNGTSFAIIERHIQAICHKEKKPYPQAVFVITDGYGDAVVPEIPQRWYWFLTRGNNQHLIPKGSKIFELENYE